MQASSCAFTEASCLSDLYSGDFDPLSILNFVILAPICAFLALLMLIIHVSFRPLRESPGDIIIAISISDFLLAVHWIITYWMPESRSGCSCLANGIFTVFVGLLDFLYNVCFVMYLKQTLRYVLTKVKIMKPAYYHGIILSVSAVSVLYLIANEDIG